MESNSGNNLELIVKESGLEKTKADIILSKFQNYFELAADWDRKAKTIVVTNESQTDDMKLARTGRLLLREKRIAIETARKELKEQALREGKAIDGIANVLKALIVPIEEYLEKQEKFVEFKKQAEEERIRIELMKKMEEDRIAKEKADAEERERIRLENERLKKEAEEREAKIAAELKEQEAKLAAERKAQEELLAKERKAQAEKLSEERKKAEAKAAEEKKKADAEKAAIEAKAKAEREAAEKKAAEEKKEKERLQELLKNTIECPHCHKTFQLNNK